MRVTIIYDQSGKLVFVTKEKTDIEKVHCLQADIPDEAIVDEIDIRDVERPQIIWHSVAQNDEAVSAKTEREKLIESIVARTKEGEKLRTIISETEMDNKEKWKLEEEVRAHGI